MSKLCAVAVLLAASACALADARSDAVTAEIETLLTRLAQSGCDFYRNGEWHSAEEAQAHLLRKLKAAGEPVSAEQFVDALASKSSLSGKPYQVRCGNGAPVESKTWLMQQLEQMRSPP